MHNPTIVVVAYNREKSLERLLSSLDKAVFPDDVRLVISIDKSENVSVLDIAKKYNWRYGEKTIIEHPINLGLKKHVLQCGDLTEKYGSIVMLEDDLYVSPFFYIYAKESLDFYSNETSVAGISLYNHKINVNLDHRFEPVHDGYDVYFLQFASSWGQAWTRTQWSEFKKWLSVANINNEKRCIPEHVTSWSEKSWLKIFICYMIDLNKYFVYPRISYTTNCNDTGTHVKKTNYKYQVPLCMKLAGAFRFTDIQSSMSIYDSFFELIPDICKKLDPTLNEYDFSVDLYGAKDLDLVNTEYVLTVKNTNGLVYQSYQRLFFPHDINIFSGKTKYNDGCYKLIKKNEAIKSSKYSLKINGIDYNIPGFGLKNIIYSFIWMFKSLWRM